MRLSIWWRWVFPILGVAVLAFFALGYLGSAWNRNIALVGESALHDDLHSLRNAVRLYRVDTGKFPESLDRLCVSVENGPKGYKGPYLDFIPKDPWYEDEVTARKILDGIDAHGWMYDEETGRVRSASDVVGSNGIKYSDW